MHESSKETPVRSPMSPCISVCALDAQGYCSGCLRTREEIAGWIRMSPAQQWELIGRLEQRHLELRGRPAPRAGLRASS